MFAFALWDPEREQLFFARDPLGEKPFYWATRGGVFIFGSEIKAILAHPAVTAEVNQQIIGSYLSNLVTASPATLYEGIQKLPPGHCGMVSEAGVHIQQYKDITKPRAWRDVTFEDSSAAVLSLLRDSVTARLMADVPVGVLLSGGVDSTALVALLDEGARGVDTFTVGFKDDKTIDERDEARWVADHFGTRHHEIVISQSDAMQFLPQLVHHQDEPLADPVCIPLNFVCKKAREAGVPVVLAGEGADELFWGYPSYSRLMRRRRALVAMAALPPLLRRRIPRAVRRSRQPRVHDLLSSIAGGRQAPMHGPLGLSSFHVDQLLAGGKQDFQWIPKSGAQGESPFDTLAFDTQEYEFQLRLPELLLMRIDRFSMANSVEARVPFLSPDLVDLAYRMPLAHRMNGSGAGKLVLKHALRGVVPDRVLDRRKQGFGAPISTWFEGYLGQALDEFSRSDTLRAYFNTVALRELLEEHRVRGGLAFVLWPVLNFALWHRAWIENESLDEALLPFIPA
jgi:asparagine synthase (glutamine-hydrolysing)